MPKIKGWTRSKYGEKLQWNNENSESSIRISRNVDGNYTVDLKTDDKRTYNIWTVKKEFRIKEKARQYAVRWMRRHPQG